MSNIDIVIKIVSLIFMSSVTVFAVYFMTAYILREIKSHRDHQVEYSNVYSWRNEILRRIHVLESNVRSTSETLKTQLDLLNRITTIEHHIFLNAPEEKVKFNVADLEKRVKALEKKVKADE